MEKMSNDTMYLKQKINELRNKKQKAKIALQKLSSDNLVTTFVNGKMHVEKIVDNELAEQMRLYEKLSNYGNEYISIFHSIDNLFLKDLLFDTDLCYMLLKSMVFKCLLNRQGNGNYQRYNDLIIDVLTDGKINGDGLSLVHDGYTFLLEEYRKNYNAMLTSIITIKLATKTKDITIKQGIYRIVNNELYKGTHIDKTFKVVDKKANTMQKEFECISDIKLNHLINSLGLSPIEDKIVRYKYCYGTLETARRIEKPKTYVNMVISRVKKKYLEKYGYIGGHKSK